MGDHYILRVSVDNAQKEVNTLESYISYRVSTETNIPEICKLRPSTNDDVERRSNWVLSSRLAEAENNDPNNHSKSSVLKGDAMGQSERKVMSFSVRRRYNDFRWLFDRLHSATLSGSSVVILAPFAERHVLNLDRFAREFVVRRCALLNGFVQRVARHPKLRRSGDLHALLAESASGFEQYMRNHSMSTSFIVSAKLLRAFERVSGGDHQAMTDAPRADDALIRFSNYGIRFGVLITHLNSAFQSLLSAQTGKFRITCSGVSAH